MAVSHLTMKCPFCNKGDIEILYVPSTVRPLKGPWGGSKPTLRRAQENVMVKSEKCPVCGKSQKEIEKGLENEVGNKVSHEESLKRLRESGLPTRIEE
jgi:hypothetical protein